MSYHSADRDEVIWIADELKRRGVRVFVDRDGLVGGQDWREHISRLLPEIPCVIVCVGPHGFGTEQGWEIEAALQLWRTSSHRLSIVPLFLRDAAADPKRIGQLANFTWIEIGDRSVRAIEMLVAAIRGEAPGNLPRDPDPSTIQCPFMGLRSFEERDAPFFHGREQLTATLLAKVAANRFVAVVGASGSGKSSLVNAGLLPRLRTPRDQRPWLIARMRPDRDPMRSLANALVNLGRSDLSAHELLRNQEQLFVDLSQQPARTAAAMATISEHSGNAPLLLFVDQCEELFTLGDDTAVATGGASPRDKLIDALVAVASDQSAPLHVIASMRADQFHRVTQDPRLNSLFSTAQVNVGEMTRDELRRAMEEPARRAGLVFEPGLVDRILDDMHGQASALPLLEFVLERLWLERDEQRRMLLRGAYERSGRVSHAIAQHADEVFDRLSPADQADARELLTALVRLGQNGADSRRPASLSDLKPELKRITELLSGKQARLLSIDDHKVEIAHEALIREWSRLRGWLQTERKHLLLRQHLESRAQQWEERSRGDPTRADEGLLDPGWPLAEAQELAQLKPHLMSALSHRYVTASVEHSEQLRLRENASQERLEAHRRRAHRLRMAIVTTAAVCFAILAVGAGYAYWRESGLRDQVARGYGSAIDASNRLVNDVASKLGQTDRVPPAAVAAVLKHARNLVEGVASELSGTSSERRIGDLPRLTLVDVLVNEARTHLSRGDWAEFTSATKDARAQLVKVCTSTTAVARHCEIRDGYLGLLEARFGFMLSEQAVRVTQDGKHDSLGQIRKSGGIAAGIQAKLTSLVDATAAAAAPEVRNDRELRSLLLIAAQASGVQAQAMQKEAVLDKLKRSDLLKEAERFAGQCVERLKPLLADSGDIDVAIATSECQRMQAVSQAQLKNVELAKRTIAEALQRFESLKEAASGNFALNQLWAEAEIVAGWLELRPAGSTRVKQAPKSLGAGLKRYAALIRDNGDQFALRDRYIYLSRVLEHESWRQLDEETRLELLTNRSSYLAARLKSNLTLTLEERNARLADLLDALQALYTLQILNQRYDEVVRNIDDLGIATILADHAAQSALPDRELANLLEVYYWTGRAYRETRRESQAIDAFKAIYARVSDVFEKNGRDFESFEGDRTFALHRYFYAWAIGQLGGFVIDNIRDDVILDRQLQEARAIVKAALDRRPNNVEFKIANANIVARFARRQDMRGELEPALASYREAASLGSSDAIRILRDRYLRNAYQRSDKDSPAELERLRLTVAPVRVGVMGKSGILPNQRQFTAYLVPARANSDSVDAELNRLKRYYDAEIDPASVAKLRAIVERAAKISNYSSRDLLRALHVVEREESRKNIFGSSALAKYLESADYAILNKDYGQALQRLDAGRTVLEKRIKTPDPTPADAGDWGMLATQYFRLAFENLRNGDWRENSIASRARSNADAALRQAVDAAPAGKWRREPGRSAAERRQIRALANMYYDLAGRLVPLIDSLARYDRTIYAGSQSYQERAVQMHEELARKATLLYHAAQDGSGISRRDGQRVINLGLKRAEALLTTANFWTKPVSAERSRLENPRQRAMDALLEARSLLIQLVKVGGSDDLSDNLEVRILMGMADAHWSLGERDTAIRLASQAADFGKRSIEHDRGDLNRRRSYADALEKLGEVSWARGRVFLDDARTVHANNNNVRLSTLVKNLIKRSEEDLVLARESYELAVRERAIILQLDISQMDRMCVCKVSGNIQKVVNLMEDAAWLNSRRETPITKDIEDRYLLEARQKIEKVLENAIETWTKIEQRQSAGTDKIDEDTALLRLYKARAKDILAANKIKMGGKGPDSHKESIATLEETTELMRLIADNQPEEFLWEYGNALSNLSWSLYMTGQGLRGAEQAEAAWGALKNYYFNLKYADRRNIKANYAHAALLRGDIPAARSRYMSVGKSSSQFKIWREQIVGDLRELSTVDAYAQWRSDIARIIDDLLRS